MAGSSGQVSGFDPVDLFEMCEHILSLDLGTAIGRAEHHSLLAGAGVGGQAGLGAVELAVLVAALYVVCSQMDWKVFGLKFEKNIEKNLITNL